MVVIVSDDFQVDFISVLLYNLISSLNPYLKLNKSNEKYSLSINSFFFLSSNVLSSINYLIIIND